MTTPDIFLSYTHEDAATAKRFADGFAAEGLSVWWDTALCSGEAYDEVTEAALRGAKAVVVLWSPRSVVSRWVRAEATIADRNKTLVPVMIESCERPIMFELTQTAELGHWRGEAGDKAWTAFVSDVREFVDTEAPVSAPNTAPATPATVEETLKPGQSGDAPSLAVLPFTNRSALAEDEVFAEGMVEDVISALSQGVNVRVLGSTTTANLSRAAISDLAGVGRQLGVRYFLEGNVRRVGASLRVTTQLLEAASGEIIWTERFDRPLSELAELQENLVLEIASRLDVQVYDREIARILKKPSDITAWEAVSRAVSAYRKYDAASLARAMEEAVRAVAIAPDYGLAHSMLAVALATTYLASADDPALVQRVRESVERALAMAPDDALTLGLVGLALADIGDPEEGVRHARRAVQKAPGSGLLHFFYGTALGMQNRPLEALKPLETAERLMPGSHLMFWVQSYRALSLHALGRWEEADFFNDQSIELYPTFGFFHIFKARLSMLLGREEGTRQLVATARRMGWDLALAETWWRRNYSCNPELVAADLPVVRALFATTESGT